MTVSDDSHVTADVTDLTPSLPLDPAGTKPRSG